MVRIFRFCACTFSSSCWARHSPRLINRPKLFLSPRRWPFLALVVSLWWWKTIFTKSGATLPGSRGWRAVISCLLMVIRRYLFSGFRAVVSPWSRPTSTESNNRHCFRVYLSSSKTLYDRSCVVLTEWIETSESSSIFLRCSNSSLLVFDHINRLHCCVVSIQSTLLFLEVSRHLRIGL